MLGATIGAAALARVRPGQALAGALRLRVLACCPRTDGARTGGLRTDCLRAGSPRTDCLRAGGLGICGGRGPLRRGRGRGGRWLVRG